MKVVEDVFPLCLQIGLPEVQSVQQALHQDCQLSVKEVGFKWEFLLRIRAWLSVFGLQKVSWFQSVLFIFQNFPKNQRKIWQISAPESKKWSNHKGTILLHKVAHTIIYFSLFSWKIYDTQNTYWNKLTFNPFSPFHSNIV